MPDPNPQRFDYTASAVGHKDQSFTSAVEYQPGDELPLGHGRWIVADLEEVGWTRWDDDRSETIVSRRLNCLVIVDALLAN
jgi:hypothetical protein